MDKAESADAMLVAKTFDIRAKIQGRNLNPLWVEFMLQRIAEGDHAGDAGFRKVFLTLTRPTLSQIARVVETPYIQDHLDKKGLHSDLNERLKLMDWNKGPDVVDVTILTMKNLFLGSGGFDETERKILMHTENAEVFHLCPDWTVPALALRAEEVPEEQRARYGDINICLESDTQTSGGFCMRFKRNWYCYLRTTDRDIPWSSPMKWLLVKPRVQIVG